jgi:hypothetical protein
MLFDLGGTAKSRNIALVRIHRRPVHKSLAFGISKVHRLVYDLYLSSLVMAQLVELRVLYPQNELDLYRFYLDLAVPLSHLQPNKRGALFHLQSNMGGAGARKSMESPLG